MCIWMARRELFIGMARREMFIEIARREMFIWMARREMFICMARRQHEHHPPPVTGIHDRRLVSVSWQYCSSRNSVLQEQAGKHCYLALAYG